MRDRVGTNDAACLYCYEMINARLVFMEEMEKVTFYKNILPPTPLLQRGGGYATTL